MKRLEKIVFYSLLVLFCSPIWAKLTGIFVKIFDGETIDVLVDKKPVRVHLALIDATERNQPFGARSKQAWLK